MAHISQGLRSGDWLTAPRARAYSLILLAVCGLAILMWIVASHGLIDPNGKPLGSDFSSFYAAGSMTLEGKAADAYNMAAHHAREQRFFGANTPYYGWLYPPYFFLVAAPLALLPYPLALAAWQGCTLLLYLAAIAAILRRARQESGSVASLWLPVAAAFPAVFVNLGHGQNGFLSAALLGAALLSLPQRPLVAGVLFGLLAYKPQFALVIPFALLAAGQWRTILAAGITVIVLTASSYALFGSDAWWSFLASTETSRRLLLEQGSVGFEKLQSAFAAVRMWGGSVSLAYVVQGAISTLVIGTTAWAWHSNRDRDINASLLVIATLLASPHMLDYDLVVLAISIAFLARHGFKCGFRDYEISLLAAAWLVPLISRTLAGATGIPMGLSVMLMLYTATLLRALADREKTSISAHIAQA